MKAKFLLLLLLSSLVGLLAISHQSFWIDEPYTARYAVQPDLAGWWGALKVSGGPDIQMVVYTFYLWCWEKCAGSSEYALRAANIPWFLLTQVSFWAGFQRWPRLKWAAVLCGMFNPFLWRYLDELRPYAMEYAGAAAVIGSLAWVAGEKEIRAGWWLAFGAALFILCGSTSLGIPWAGAAVAALACLSWGRKQIVWNRAAVVACLASLSALGGLAAYYIWTIPHGLGGTSEKEHALAALCFAIYECAGFSGLGPGRIAIAETTRLATFTPYLGVLAFAGVMLLGVLTVAGRDFYRQADRAIKWSAVAFVIPPLSLLLALVFLKDWHATGRHFMPASVVLTLAAALAGANAWREKSAWKMGWMTVFLLLWVISCLELRFAPRHLRDDYRDAAKVAEAALAKRERVWWAASEVAGMYYGVPLTSDAQNRGKALLLWRPVSGDLKGVPPPDCIVLSKPRFFDPNEVVTSYLSENQYEETSALPAFSIWERHSPQARAN